MRNLILLFTFFFTVVSCTKENDSNVSRIVIKGIISGNNIKSAGSKSANQLSLSDARKVLVFNSTSYKLFNIENSSFTAEATSGTASALAFLDKDNNYIGCLNAGGLNVLPLVSLKDGDNTSIDLSTLTLDGTSVIPANNPIGDEINLNEDEITWYKELGVYYESLSKNIDADNDGVPDILNNKEIKLSTIFDFYCGSWGLNNSAPQIIDTSNFAASYTLRIEGGNSLTPSNSTIKFSGPGTSPYPGITQWNYNICPNGNFISFFNRNASLPFAKGTYTVTIDNKDYTLNYSNVNIKHFFILAEPTVQTNNENKIVSVTVMYKDINDSFINADNFVYQTMVQLDGNTRICEIGKLWADPESKHDTEKYTFTLPNPVPISELKQIVVCYQDLIGNAYNLHYYYR